jgi:hypothetical protein
MTEDFDPYYQWLGISPKHHPPNHYRLLGLELFETNADVIANAADQRMAHVRTFQTGQRANYSQKLLNELSTARRCLLDRGQKWDYDAALRAQVDREAGPKKAASTPPPPPSGPGDDHTHGDADRATSSPSAAGVMADIRAASRLTVLQAERLRLTQLQLRPAYQALGKHLYRDGHFRRELYEEFDALDLRRNAGDTAGGDDADLDDETDKPHRNLAGKVLDRAKSEARSLEFNSLLRALGETAYERFGKGAGPPEVVSPLEILTRELADMDAEIAKLSEARTGRVFDVRWLAIIGCTVVVAALLLLLRMPTLAFLTLFAIPLAFVYFQFAKAKSTARMSVEEDED